MASNYLDIEKALVSAVLSVDNVTPIQLPGQTIDDADKPNGLWLALHNMRAQSEPVTLGDAGEDNHPGFLQIDINYPKQQGTKQVLIKADEFASFFTAGKALIYNTQQVKVLSSSLSPGRYVGGYYRVSLTINYYARTTRTP